jgi:hypothetical protein
MKIKVKGKIVFGKSKKYTGKHSKKESHQKNSKNYKKPYNRQGR